MTTALPTRRGPGSLNDILPKPGTPEYRSLPEFIRREVDQLRKGWRPLSPGDISEHAMASKRVDLLSSEIKNLAAKLEDVHAGQSALGDKLIPLVQSVLEQVTAISNHVAAHDAELAEHKAAIARSDARHDGHDAKFAEHDHRLATVEALLMKKPAKRNKRPPRRRKK